MSKKAAYSLFFFLLLLGQTAWAQTDVTLSVDSDIPEGTAGHWYVNLQPDSELQLTLTADDLAAGKGTFKVYDDGGKNGDYSFSFDGSLTITAPTGYVVVLSGTVTTYGNAEFLNVYDSNGSTLIDNAHSLTNHNNPVFVSTFSSGNSMSLSFYHNRSILIVIPIGHENEDPATARGLDLTVTFVDSTYPYAITINEAPGGTVASSSSEAVWNAPVTLTATPAAGYMLADFGVKDAHGISMPMEGGWHTDNQTTFLMPDSDLTVTPVFTDNPSAEGGLYVNMPATGTKTLDFPNSVESFKLYDNGGKDGLYSRNCDGTLVLTAPEGDKLMLTGTLRVGAGDKLYVYDGNGTGSQLLFEGGENDADVGTVVSTGRNMTIRYTSDADNPLDGLDLIVEVYNDTPHTITINTTGSGTVTARVGGNIVTQASFGQTVDLFVLPDSGYALVSVQVGNGGMQHILQPSSMGTYPFDMPAHAVTVNVVFMEETALHWGEGNDGSAEHPYVISTKSGWNLLVRRSKTNSYTDKYFEFAADISGVTNAIATASDYPFCGHIDGKGHKVTLAMETIKTPAMIIWGGAGCSVENLTVDGTITMTDGMYGAGFISQAEGAVVLTNCRSSVTINYTPNYASPYNGGFIGKLGSGASATLTRCLFDGAFISSTAATFGGMVGSGGNITIQYSVVVTSANTSLTATVNNDNNAFSFQPNSTNWSHNYFVYDIGTNHLNGIINRYNGNDQPLAWQLMFNEGATASHSGTGTVIGNGAATVYADGFSCDDKEYYQQGATITLGSTPADGMTCVGYTSSDVSIGEGGTFSMPSRVVTVRAQYLRTDYINHWQASLTRDGSSEAKAYLITTPEGLNLLSSEVNDGNKFAGKFFKLDADITYSHTTAWNDDSSTENNFTAIGKYDSFPFSGTFDGNGKTISGIRIFGSKDYQGIFQFVGKEGVVKNVTLADARMTERHIVGGIVGYNYGAVVNCHVAENVCIHATIYKYSSGYGGIAGNNHGTVSYCSSAVSITIADGDIVDTSNTFGGIVGSNSGNVNDCIAAGAIVAAVTNAGAIVGSNDSYYGILTNNTYHSCLVGANAFNIGVGFHGISGKTGEHGDRTGATLDRTKLFLYDSRDNSIIINAYWAPVGHIAFNGNSLSVSSLTATLQGHTLYKDGTWHTLCLPFDVSSFSGTPLEGASVYGLSTTGTNLNTTTGALTLAFSPVTSIEAGKPYIVKWASGSDVVNPVFSGVKITNSDPSVISSSDNRVKFAGQYGPFEINGSNRSSIIFVDGGNKVGYSQADHTLPALGACFRAEGARTISVDFGDGTGIQYLIGHLNGGVYWATFYNQNVRFTLAEGAQAYTMGSNHQLYRLGDDGRTIPADKAVVIISDSPDIGLTSSISTEEVADHSPSGNILKGSDSAVTVSSLSGTPYVLGVVDGVLGFYKYTGATIPANKAYYVQ